MKKMLCQESQSKIDTSASVEIAIEEGTESRVDSDQQQMLAPLVTEDLPNERLTYICSYLNCQYRTNSKSQLEEHEILLQHLK